MSRKAVIIANGVLGSSPQIREVLDSADYIIAADGGVNHLAKLGIEPQVIIGDLDSALPESLHKFPAAEVIEDTDEDATDLVKALRHVIPKDYGEIILLAATGGRNDMTLANISLLRMFSDAAAIIILDDTGEVRYVFGEERIDAIPSQKISIIVMECPALVSTTGLRWEFKNTILGYSPDAVSNEVLSTSFTLKAGGNGVFLFLLNEKADGTPL